MAIVRKHIYFFPVRCRALDFVTVQKNAARANNLTGWVDNLWDGRVGKWKSRGELSGIERMIQEIEMGSFIQIENYQMEDLPVDESEWSFIRNEKGCQKQWEFCFW